MSDFCIGLLCALALTNQPASISNRVAPRPEARVAVPDPTDPLEQEFQKLMQADDNVQAEVDQIIRDNLTFASKGAGLSEAELRQHVLDHFAPVRKAYEDFIQRHPKFSRARVAYASFLSDTKDEESAEEQLQQALALDTNSPAIYNNLANIYGHIGPVKKAFEYYGKAIALNPEEPVYYHNLGTTVFLFRTEAMDFYKISEQQVFTKTFELYSNAMRLAPDDFPLASDVAQTYYGIQPLRTDEALRAWTNALRVAHDEIEREGVYVHLARLKLLAGRFTDARAHLDAVTNEMYAQLKKRVLRNLNEREQAAQGTNKPASTLPR